MIFKLREKEEEKKEPVVEFWLDNDSECIRLRARRKDELATFTILVINETAGIYAPRCVNESLGLPLTSDGRILISQ